MFVSEQFAFLELHKTGCTHIRKVLTSVLDGELVGSHNLAPKELFNQERIFMGSVRDPWDWYLSLWTYGCEGKGGVRGNLLQKNSHVWQETYADKSDTNCFRQWLSRLMSFDHAQDIGEDYSRYPLSLICGLLTYRYLKLFCNRKGQSRELDRVFTYEQLRAYESERNFIDYFIRNESLETDLFGILEQHGVTLADEKRAEIVSLERSNATSRPHGTAFYYDSATEAMIARRERLIIERFGYIPPSQRAVAA